MPQSSPQTQVHAEKDESGFVELFNLSRLVQTVNSIAIEAKDEEEMLQLTINALCIFTGWPLGHIFLRDAADKATFRCSNIHYVKDPDLYGTFHQETLLKTYDESSQIIKDLTARPTPAISIYQRAEILSPSDIKTSYRVLIPLISRGELFGFFELIAREGDEEPNKHLIQVFHQVGYRIGSVVDSFITSEELEIANNKREALLSSIGDGVFAIDKERNIVHLNRRGEELSGYKAVEVMGKPYNEFLKFIKEKDGSENVEFIKLALSGKLTKMKDHTQLIRKDGRKVHVADSAAPLKNKAGDIIGAIVVFRDATQEREIEHMREEMISLTSHQLKAPLTAIKGSVELLKGGQLGSEEKKRADEIEEVAQSMVSLLGDLLGVSKIEQGSVELKLGPTQVETLISDSIEQLSPIAKKRKVSVEFKKPDKPLPTVEADPDYLREALGNIISNAIDYTKNKVVIEIKQQDGALLLTCEDNGIGIPRDEQAKIFEKFYRTSNAKQTKITGTGLGLSIAKAIIEKVGGKIWFESAENKGAKFYVSLPLSY